MGQVTQKTIGEQLKELKEFNVVYSVVDGKPNTSISVDGEVSALTVLGVLAQCTNSAFKILSETQDLDMKIIRTVFANILQALGEEE